MQAIMFNDALAKQCALRNSLFLRLMRWQLAFLILLFFPTVLVQAQYRASLRGVVTDTQGAVVSNATVALVNMGTNQTMRTITNSEGIYTFNALPPANFQLTIERDGFEKKVIQNVKISAEQANAFDVQLQIGQVEQTVTVLAQDSTLDKETASTSGTITDNEIQHMPSFGRDVFQLSQLTPGVFGDAAQNGGGGSYSLPGSNMAAPGQTDGIFKTENAPQIIANGGQNGTNGISIDGISTESAVWGGSSVITPSEDSVQDVKVIANNYDAEYGRFSSAQTLITSKGGSNEVHGSLFFKAERPGLNAYQAYSGTSSTVEGSAADRGLLKDMSRFNQLGGSVGGPLWKDKVFAFFNYETLRNNTRAIGTGWYDTAQFDQLAPSGSLASTYLNFTGSRVSSIGQLTVTCAQIGLVQDSTCNQVNGGLNVGTPLTGALGAQDLSWVSNSQPGVGSGLGSTPDIADYYTSGPNEVSEGQYNGRIDALPTQKDRIMFTLYWVPVTTTSDYPSAREYDLYHHSAVNDAFAVIWDHTFSPTLVNEARANAGGWRWNEITDNPQEPFGLPGDGFDPIGNASLNYFGGAYPSVFNQWTYTYSDVLTKTAGRHNIKFGGSDTRLYYLNEATYNVAPFYTFFNVWDFLNDAPEGEGATFNPQTGIPTPDRQDNREDLWGFFVQDDFKLSPNLTLNLGLRYSYFGPYSSKEGNLSTLVMGSGSNMFTDMSLRVGGNLYTAQKGNFSPELGFAWNPKQDNGKLVIRGGFGLNYNQEEIAIASNGIENPPNANSPNFSSISPTNISPDIVYALSSNIHSLLDYPSNPHTILQFNSGNIPTNSATSVTGFPSNLPTAYTYHYSLGAEYSLNKEWVASLGYQGSIGRHLINQYNANVLGAVRGYTLNPNVNSVDFYGNEGNSSYNAMLVDVKHIFSRQFLADVSYSWAKSMDTGSQPYYEDPYPYEPRLAWGRSDYNVQNAFKAYGLWQPVFFHGSNRWLEKVAGGWSLSGILNLHTGFPWTPTYSNIVDGGSLYYQNSGYGTLRPAKYLGGAKKSTSNKTFESGNGFGGAAYNSNFSQGALSYFTVPSYTPVTANFPATFAAPQAPGISRNSFNGPNYRDLDATLTKAFGLPHMRVLGEQAKIEIRADVFNVLNTTNLNVSSINTAISNDGVTSNPTFGEVGSSGATLGARVVDLQARFSF